MPIDVASGALHLAKEDVRVFGKYDLVWDRRYDSSDSARRSVLHGFGWTSQFDLTLARRADEFLLTGPGGSQERLVDCDGAFDRGETVSNFGAFAEVFSEGARVVVRRWNVDSGEVTRYVFSPSHPGTAWPLSHIEDVTGQGVDLHRDEQGRVIAIVQRLERRTLAIEYGRHGFVAVIKLRSADDEAQLAQYEYDTGGRLVTAYDAAGNADHYEYDTNGRLAREIVKDGGVFFYKYDHRGRCVRSSGLDRYDEKTVRYLDGARCTEVKDSRGGVNRYFYLESGQVVSEIDTMGAVSLTGYDEHGRIISKTDANGETTK